MARVTARPTANVRDCGLGLPTSNAALMPEPVQEPRRFLPSTPRGSEKKPHTTMSSAETKLTCSGGDSQMASTSNTLGAIVLIAAGIYQWTPPSLKASIMT